MYRERLQLDGRPPIAHGTVRDIYEHPSDPCLLVKTIRQEALDGRWGGDGPRRKKWERAAQYVSFTREFEEYCALRARFPDARLPVERVYGLAETDRGLGLVVEKIAGRGGRLAPTVREFVIRNGLTPELRERLEEFSAAVLNFGIVTSSLISNALVIEGGRCGRIVIVDGLGEKSPFRLNQWSSAFRRRTIGRRLSHLKAKLERMDGARKEPAPIEALPAASGVEGRRA